MRTSIPVAKFIIVLAAVSMAVPGSGAAAQDNTVAASQPLSWAWGSERAIIEVVEFTDLGCGYCAQFHKDSYATLFSEYVETGKVRWIFAPFASGRFRGSFEATLFLACAAEQGKALSYLRSIMFDRQRDWSAGEVAEVLAGYVQELGLDQGQYSQCAASDEVRERLEENGRRAIAAGVRGTPTFLVQGFPVMGALPLDFFRAHLDRTIERVQRGRRVSSNSTPLPASRP